MSSAFNVGTNVIATLAFTNPDGSVGKPASPPTWSNDNPAVWNPTVAADGMSAQGPVLAAGNCDVQVVAEGDALAGKDTVTLTGTLTGNAPAEEISGGTLTFAADAGAPAASRRR